MKYRNSILIIAFMVALSGCAKSVAIKTPLDELPEMTQDAKLPECMDWYGVNCYLSPDKLEKMIQSGKDVNAWVPTKIALDSAGNREIKLAMTPLLSAAFRNDVSSAKRLLSAGANPNRNHSKYKMSLLSLASAFGNANSVQILLKAGADVHQGAPLVAAAINDRHGVEIIHVLVDSGADPNAIDTAKHGPGIIAKMSSFVSMSDELYSILSSSNIHPIDVAKTIKNMNALLDVGANPKNAHYSYISNLYQKTGWYELMNRMIDGGFDVNAKNYEGKTLLMSMCCSYAIIADLQSFRLVVNAGADVNARTENNRTALHYLSISDANIKHDVMKLIIDRGADVNVVDHLQKTPLQYVVDNGDCDAFSMLIVAGADLNKIDGADIESIMKGAILCGDDTLKAVIAAGIDVNLSIDDDTSPLRFALMNNRLNSMRILLDAGASYRYSSENDILFPMKIINAKVNGLTGDDVRRLIQAGVNVDWKSQETLKTPLMLAAQKHLEDIFFALLDAGAKVDDVDINGNSVLHYAVTGGSVNIIKALIAKKANVKARNHDKLTPLMFATSHEVVSALVHAGADINAFNDIDQTVLLYFLRRKIDDGDVDELEDTALMMIRYGAKINVQDMDGVTPLIAATEAKYNKVVDFLINAEADVNAADKNGYTPLMAAAEFKNTYALRALLDHGALINAESLEGMTPLLYSLKMDPIEDVKEGNLIADILLSRGANLSNNKKISVLKVAILAGNVSVVEKYLNEYHSLMIENDDGEENALLIAIRSFVEAHYRYEEVMYDIKCFENGITEFYELETEEYAPETWLEIKKSKAEKLKESIAQYKKVCDLLIDAGADVKSLIDNGDLSMEETILLPNVLRILLEAGVEPDAGKFSTTPLRKAIMAKNLESMQLLIDAGADLSDVFALTALNLRSGNAETMQKLIENGLDVTKVFDDATNVSDRVGATVLMLVGEPTLGLMQPDDVEKLRKTVDVLIKAGVKINAQDAAGRTALFYAAEATNLIGLKILLDVGVDASIKNNDGKTVLDYAVEREWDEGVQVLKSKMSIGGDDN